ncbi:tetraacyldisaccharide 4'-kinase [Gammaproteobacteria bacterium 42_54_T18]|nr:tetraacyldisaccharide 4'-kinase [Gammaproteobacteria bacterium 42_54_T18]
MHKIEKYFQQVWYEKRKPPCLLKPLEIFYRRVVDKRRLRFVQNVNASYSPEVPVIIVGNITVGGTGKTPLTLFLIEGLKGKGLNVGVISRGYGGSAKQYPIAVDKNSSAREVGDEPLMVYLRSGAPVVVDPDRVAAAKYLEQNFNVDIIISDDGLQHYALNRSVEIVVMDATRGIGNGCCLPMGPLREPVARLASVDYLIVNGGNIDVLSSDVRSAFGNADASYSMQIMAQGLEPVFQSGNRQLPPQNTEVYGVAGIGNPVRFFSTLSEFGYQVTEMPFPDHYQYKQSDFESMSDMQIVMTEKDAVKVHSLELAPNLTNSWYLKVSANISPLLIDGILQKLYPEKLQP